ncbi:flagellar FliL protein [Halobacillus karajensis]|uniref:Flagellar protein FliL n=1 Tax=Halobacillus karajensis TaxID=195088 RepID=A0A024P2P8_9BACI|nr:flagellar basal body-associated protein FliL [Halobacillus karajensis]CDQ19736.1 flagellar basal body-associated protein FliL [Halobacillus karajensis]CDQ22196.1 flagellar basal body-associated protein FliL [Halobacillus karajensis]CDQ28037.1 flagellar basal body-associated protein FliL [Halobacillus karajensis]SEH73020.1 flagellar FliL protein [Halobacillus karajensis]
MNLFKVMAMTLSTLTILGMVALVLVFQLDGKSEADSERTIDEIREASFLTEEITTDLQNGDYVRISFRIVTDSKASMEELKKRDFQVQNVLLKELAPMDTETFQSGLGDLEEKVKLKLNEFMSEGKVTEVYTVNKVLQ